MQVPLTRPALASLRRPVNSRASRRSVTPPSAIGGPLFETAVVLPALVPTLVRGALAGVVVYSTLQWSFARRFRQEVGCPATLCADACSVCGSKQRPRCCVNTNVAADAETSLAASGAQQSVLAIMTDCQPWCM